MQRSWLAMNYPMLPTPVPHVFTYLRRTTAQVLLLAGVAAHKCWQLGATGARYLTVGCVPCVKSIQNMYERKRCAHVDGWGGVAFARWLGTQRDVAAQCCFVRQHVVCNGQCAIFNRSMCALFDRRQLDYTVGQMRPAAARGDAVQAASCDFASLLGSSAACANPLFMCHSVLSLECVHCGVRLQFFLVITVCGVRYDERARLQSLACLLQSLASGPSVRLLAS